MKKLLALSFVIICLLVSAVACEKEGPAEKAGKEGDRAFDSAKKKLNDVKK